MSEEENRIETALAALEDRLDGIDLQISSLEAEAYDPARKSVLYQFSGWAMIGLLQNQWSKPEDTAYRAVEMAKALMLQLETETRSEGKADE